jgi:hypothetical protein
VPVVNITDKPYCWCKGHPKYGRSALGYTGFSGVSVGIDRKVTPYIAYTGFMISNMHVHSDYILCSTDGFVGYSTHIKGNSRNLTYTTLVQFSCKCKAKSSPTVTNQLLQSNPFPRRRSRAMLPIQDSYRRPPAWYVTPS